MGLVHYSGAKKKLSFECLGRSTRPHELGFAKPLTSRMDNMPNNSASNIATADALTLLLHNQHALAAAIEELTKWLADNGVEGVATNAITAMEALDRNAAALTDAIMRIRR